MTDKPVKIGSISAQILALMLTNEHYKDRLDLLMDLSAALNSEYHALADAGAPLVQIEEPAIHQIVSDPKQPIKPAAMGRSVQCRSEGPARQMRGVVPHLLGEPGGATRGQQGSILQGGFALSRPARLRRAHRRRRVQPRHGPRALRHDDLQKQEGRARCHQPSHAASRAAGGSRRPHPPRAQIYRAGTADPDERLRLRPPVDEPDARVSTRWSRWFAAPISCARSWDCPKPIFPPPIRSCRWCR